jgi:hypothetical protein
MISSSNKNDNHNENDILIEEKTKVNKNNKIF